MSDNQPQGQNHPHPNPPPEGEGTTLASPALEAAADTERARIDWLKAIAVLVITIATVVILFKVVAYREEIADRLGFNPLRSSVQVFLRVTPTYSDEDSGRGVVKLDVAGRATMQGEPLQTGVVRLTVEDVVSQYYLGGEVVEIRGERFEAPLVLSPDARGFRSSSVTVRAEVTGAHRGKPVAGAAELNIGYPRSFSHAVAWSLAGVALVLVIVLICLFTGAIGPSKQRGLYMAMYTLVFGSLAVPVVVSTMILQSSYLISIMEKAPVGLVRATSASSKSEPQWFINIGGIVTQRDETSTSPRPRNAKASAPTPESKAAPAADSDAAKAAAKAGDTKAAPGDARATNPLEVSTSSRSSPYIEGGVAVPFYVVLLAMFGAGINLTRRVPEIQEEFRDFPAARRSSWFMKPAGEPQINEEEQRRYTFAFRRALIQNFMYLLSAPFLAMAVYYLLQVVANEPARPILVLVAFATGLIADTLVNRIIRFAEDTLRLAPEHRASAAISAANARIVKINAMVREEQAKLAEAIFLAEVARAHEDIAAARADRSKEMPDVPFFDPIETIEQAAAQKETHPHPNPPLEGEGGAASQKGESRPPPGPEGT